MSECDVSVIIVNWNARDYLRDCIRSVLEQTNECKVEVIVVDNASNDGSQEMLATDFPEIRTICNEVNRGFAGANNQGIQIARGRYVLLLNPDTIVLDGVIHRTVAYSDKHPDVAVVGCQVYEDRTRIQPTCFSFPGPLNLLLLQTGLARAFPSSRILGRPFLSWWDRKSELEVEVVSGMYMLVKREAIADVGLMDEDYFVYAEEADWCHRFWKNGWRCVFAPVGRIMHLDGGSKSTLQVRGEMYVEQQKSLILFNRKNLGLVAAAGAKGVFITSMLARLVFWFTVGRFVGNRSEWRTKARLALAASAYHILGREPVG